jgi:hypothetical protein
MHMHMNMRIHIHINLHIPTPIHIHIHTTNPLTNDAIRYIPTQPTALIYRRRSIENASHHRYLPSQSDHALAFTGTLNAHAEVARLAGYGHDMRYAGTALALATEFGNCSVVKTLLEAGKEIDVNIQRATDQRGPLHVACATGQLDCLALLVHHSSTDYGVVDQSGETPLFAAIRNDQYETVHYLVEVSSVMRVQVFETNKVGHTALCVAERRNISLTNEVIAMQKQHASGSKLTPSMRTTQEGELEKLTARLGRNCEIVKCLLRNADSNDIPEEENEDEGGGTEKEAQQRDEVKVKKSRMAKLGSVMHEHDCFAREELFSTLKGFVFAPPTMKSPTVPSSAA